MGTHAAIARVVCAVLAAVAFAASGAAAKLGGAEGKLVALLPETARFRTDPFDDGCCEHWQDPSADLSQRETLATTSGWDTQGRPYTGAA
ncbi:MAG TPA: hypothetical protein DCM87_16705 [Planctomycetes bacterium]|nr:hypothetical protein [Planctomycetota bacterium]